MSKSYKRICKDIQENPYVFKLSYEDAKGILNDPNVPQDIKDNIIDRRDQLPTTNENVLKYMRNKEDRLKLQDEFDALGGFVFTIYKRLDSLYDNNTLTIEDKAKILLLATYMGYDNKVKYKNNIPILKQQLGLILRIGDRATRNFLNKVTKLGIVEINKDKEIILNNNLFIKGNTQNIKIDSKDFGYIRVFINSYQYLYENIPTRKLKYLGIIYNILGYVNFYHNVIVKNNPEEKDISKVEPMTLREMLTVCGYKEDMSPSTESGIKKILLNIKLKNNMPLFAIVHTDNKTKILINPYVTYASSNINTWNSTLELIFKNFK